MKRLTVLLVLMLLVTWLAPSAAAQGANPLKGEVRLDVRGSGGEQTYSVPIQILLFLTVMSFIPSIVISLTSFTRIIIVFHFLRQALGTSETPSNQIMIGLTLFLTLFIMAPVGEQINKDALQPMMDGKI